MNKIEYGTEFLDHLKDSVHDLYDENKELKKEIERLKEQSNNYAKRIINVLNYINRHAYSNISKNYDELYNGQIEELVNILEGVDK